MDDEKRKMLDDEFLNAKLKGTLDSADTTLDFLKKMFNFDPNSINFYFVVWTPTNKMDSKKRIVEITQPGLFIPREDLLEGFNNEKVKLVQNYFRNISDIFDVVDKNEVDNVLSLMMDLAKISYRIDELNNDTVVTNSMSLKEFAKEYPVFDWDFIIRKMIFPGIAEIPKDEIVNVATPKFFKKLDRILADAKQSTIKQFALFQYIGNNLKNLNKDMHNVAFNYGSAAYGIQKLEERWNRCSRETND